MAAINDQSTAPEDANQLAPIWFQPVRNIPKGSLPAL